MKKFGGKEGANQPKKVSAKNPNETSPTKQAMTRMKAVHETFEARAKKNYKLHKTC